MYQVHTLHILLHIILTTILWGMCCCYPHFRDKEAETRNRKATCQTYTASSFSSQGLTSAWHRTQELTEGCRGSAWAHTTPWSWGYFVRGCLPSLLLRLTFFFFAYANGQGYFGKKGKILTIQIVTFKKAMMCDARNTFTFKVAGALGELFPLLPSSLLQLFLKTLVKWSLLYYTKTNPTELISLSVITGCWPSSVRSCRFLALTLTHTFFNPPNNLQRDV